MSRAHSISERVILSRGLQPNSGRQLLRNSEVEIMALEGVMNDQDRLVMTKKLSPHSKRTSKARDKAAPRDRPFI